jgi:hypothetical protein
MDLHGSPRQTGVGDVVPRRQDGPKRRIGARAGKDASSELRGPDD